MVTIRVGIPSTDFLVHEEVLKTATESHFLQVAFTNGFKETQTGILELPEDDPEAFRVLLNWVYVTATGFADCELRAFPECFRFSILVKLYVLASKYTMNALHDAIITHFWWYNTISEHWYEMGLTQDALSYFEANTMADCPLEKLLVDWMADDALSGKSDPFVDDYDGFRSMPNRLMRAAFVKINLICRHKGKKGYTNQSLYGSTQAKGTLCSYHCHDNKKSCPAPNYS